MNIFVIHPVHSFCTLTRATVCECNLHHAIISQDRKSLVKQNKRLSRVIRQNNFTTAVSFTLLSIRYLQRQLTRLVIVGRCEFISVMHDKNFLKL